MRINWQEFGNQKGISNEDLFENMSLNIFVRLVGDARVDAYKNQPGLESEPVLFEGKYYGFQSKFFENKYDWSQVEDSLLKAIQKYDNLDHIYLFSNKDRTLYRGKTSPREKKILKKAKKKSIEIEYITEKKLESILGKVDYLDVREFYFTSPLNVPLLKNSLSVSDISLIKSNIFLPIKLNRSGLGNITNPQILKKKAKFQIINGAPGSGKTFLMKNLFYLASGLNKRTVSEINNHLVTTRLVPVIFNLKTCNQRGLQEMFSAKLNMLNLSSQYKVVLFLDGLDELNSETSEKVIYDISELSNRPEIDKVIISCRTGNFSNTHVRSVLEIDDKNVYEIATLDIKQLEEYFKARKDKEKINSFRSLSKKNKEFLKSINDILMLEIFWENILSLGENPEIHRLIALKIKSLINNHKFNKNLSGLNLLDPKEKKILTLISLFSEELYKEFSFSFQSSQLSSFLKKELPRCDYQSLNQIQNYLCDLFFNEQAGQDATYSFSHRVYQDYLYIAQVIQHYEKDRTIIRKNRIIAHSDLFENLFIPMLSHKYETDVDFAGSAEVATMKTYLGLDRGFGIQEPYHLESDELLHAVLSLNPYNFDLMMNNQSLDLRNQIGINLPNIVHIANSLHRDYAKNEFDIFYDKFKKSNKKNDSYWEHIINNYTEWIYLLHNFEYKSIDQINLDLNKLIEKNKELTFGHGDKKKSMREKYEEYFHIFLCAQETEKTVFFLNKRENESLVSFLRDADISYLLKPEVFHLLKSKLKQKDFTRKKIENSLKLIFLKKVLGLKLNQGDYKIAEERWQMLGQQRDIDFRTMSYMESYLWVSYILDKNILNTLFMKSNDFFDEKEFYSSLFNSYINIFTGRAEAEDVIHNLIDYVHIEENSVPARNYTGETIQILMLILTHSNFNSKDRKIFVNEILANIFLRNRLIRKLYTTDLDLFTEIFTKEDIVAITEENLTKITDYSERVSAYFDASRYLSVFDEQESIQYIFKGLQESILRYGWSKDPLVTSYLPDALGLLYRYQLFSKSEINFFVNESAKLAIEAVESTDNVNYFFNSIMSYLPRYDLELAEEIYTTYSRHTDYRDLSEIITAKIEKAYPYSDIAEEMKEMRSWHDHYARDRYDYYYGRFKVLVNLAASRFYTEEQRLEAFNNLCEMIEVSLKEDIIRNYSDDYYLKDEIKAFDKLCNKYNKKVLLKKEYPGTETSPGILSRRKRVSEKDFLKELALVGNKKDLRRIYDYFHNFDIDLYLSEVSSWESLYRKTFEIFHKKEAQKIIFDLLDRNYFLSHRNSSENSKTITRLFELMLSNSDNHREVIKYINRSGGHAAFIILLESFLNIGDTKRAKEVFLHFFYFGKLLVS